MYMQSSRAKAEFEGGVEMNFNKDADLNRSIHGGFHEAPDSFRVNSEDVPKVTQVQ